MHVDPIEMWRYTDQAGIEQYQQPNGYILLLRFSLLYPMPLKGLRIWNYNAPVSDGLCCGLKHCRIVINENEEFSARVIRKATGIVH